MNSAPPTATTDAVRTPRSPATQSADGVQSTTPPRRTAPAWACLLLSENADRRQRFERAARSAGWSMISCASVGEAIQQHERWKTQLATIDLGGMTGVQKSAYLQFASRVVSSDRLLLISDEPTDGEGEVWARQAGAWVYLPSPTWDDGLVDLFSEARHVAEKMTPAYGRPLSGVEPSNAHSKK